MFVLSFKISLGHISQTGERSCYSWQALVIVSSCKFVILKVLIIQSDTDVYHVTIKIT